MVTDFLRRLGNDFHSSQQRWSVGSSGAVRGWIFGDGILAFKGFTFFLLVHSHCSNLPFDQEWTKVMKTAVYAGLFFMLFLPLDWLCLGTFLQENRTYKPFSEQ